MAYVKKKPGALKWDELAGFDDIKIRAALSGTGGYGTISIGPVDVKFSIFEGDEGRYPVFPSYRAKDGTYKKQVFVQADLYNEIVEYIAKL